MADTVKRGARNRSFQDRAVTLLRSGHLGEARKVADRLIAAGGRSVADDRGIVSILNEMATCCLELAHHPDACRYAEEALTIADARLPADDAALLSALENLQDSCLATGRLADAHEMAKRALDIQVASHGRASTEAARAWQRRGVVLARIGDVEAARSALLHARDILTIASQNGNAEAENVLATTLGNLAGIHHAPDEIETAKALYAEALQLRRRLSGDEHIEVAQLHSNLGLLLSAAGDDRSALDACQQSLALRRKLLTAGHPDLIRSLIEIAWLRLRLGESGDATDVLIEALVLLSALDIPTVEARAHFLLASLLAESGATAAAILFEKLCVNGLQQVRSRSASHEQAFLNAREGIYRHLAEALIHEGRLPEAMQIVGMLKESELDDVTGGALRPNSSARLTPLERRHADVGITLRAATRGALGQAAAAKRHLAIANGITSFTAWLERLRTDFSRTERIAASIPEQNGSASNAHDCQRLQYLLSQDRVEIIATTSIGQRHYTSKFASGEVHRRILALRVSIGQKSNDWREHARVLHDVLVGPVLRDLETHSDTLQLEISLDGILRYLPFAMLHDGQRHLVERFSVVVAAGTTPRRWAGKVSTRRAAGFGVTRAHDEHRALNGVRDELKAIVGTPDNTRGLIPGNIFLDEAFTAKALRSVLERADPVIHIASHFVFRAAQEQQSYLLLGDGTRLSLPQLAALPFEGVELLALSACDTAVGSGHRQSGSEFEGLGALALNRGARHVIATLWPILDFTSATLMRDFYHLHFCAGLGAADALRQAQLRLITGRADHAAAGPARGLRDPEGSSTRAGRPGRQSHPYYWAPYVLMG